nr:MAG TPA: hypothetical protein [Caudoviricetes sp.]
MKNCSERTLNVMLQKRQGFSPLPFLLHHSINKYFMLIIPFLLFICDHYFYNVSHT